MYCGCSSWVRRNFVSIKPEATVCGLCAQYIDVDAHDESDGVGLAERAALLAPGLGGEL
jgi:hypothetical protein